MKSLTLKSHFLNLSRPSNATKLHMNPPFLVPTLITSKLKKHHAKTTISKAKLTPLETTQKLKHFAPTNEEMINGLSRSLILGTLSVGVIVLLMGVDEQNKALAWGPEGPLLEDFWDNMRRYGLYALTVSTGVLYAVFEPIVQLLKNPISAILILTIIGGGLFIVSQVVSAMIGVNEFSYQYSY
ncbi:uncharacterized protein LOC141675122 [Apium graveolens]|uniref:uncharacterized protein LOC141675122 n=1 Tax=Apium graveolens TaxID=4045 RepID=UPI003D7C0477